MIMDIVHLGCILNVKPKTISHISMTIDKHVNSFNMRKVQGSVVKIRRIYAPDERLKMIQKRISEFILSKTKPHDCAHGFVKGRSILTNASAHYGRRTIINIDIKDFFPSITSDDVFNYWISMVMNPMVAYVLTRLTTYSNHLSQGFSTSPDISNRIVYDMDVKIDRIAERERMIYTRYADDITLSTDKDVDTRSVISNVSSVVESSGFFVNRKKTKIMRPGTRQEVTGLVVNETASCQQPRIPRREKRIIRAMCHKGGSLDVEKSAERDGWLSFLSSIDPSYYDKVTKILNERLK